MLARMICHCCGADTECGCLIALGIGRDGAWCYVHKRWAVAPSDIVVVCLGAQCHCCRRFGHDCRCEMVLMPRELTPNWETSHYCWTHARCFWDG
jgi:hypothetical protein